MKTFTFRPGAGIGTESARRRLYALVGLLVCLVGAAALGQPATPPIPTTEYSRGLLTNGTAALSRAYLGISSGGMLSQNATNDLPYVYSVETGLWYPLSAVTNLDGTIGMALGQSGVGSTNWDDVSLVAYVSAASLTNAAGWLAWADGIWDSGTNRIASGGFIGDGSALTNVPATVYTNNDSSAGVITGLGIGTNVPSVTAFTNIEMYSIRYPVGGEGTWTNYTDPGGGQIFWQKGSASFQFDALGVVIASGGFLGDGSQLTNLPAATATVYTNNATRVALVTGLGVGTNLANLTLSNATLTGTVTLNNAATVNNGGDTKTIPDGVYTAVATIGCPTNSRTAVFLDFAINSSSTDPTNNATSVGRIVVQVAGGVGGTVAEYNTFAGVYNSTVANFDGVSNPIALAPGWALTNSATGTTLYTTYSFAGTADACTNHTMHVLNVQNLSTNTVTLFP